MLYTNVAKGVHRITHAHVNCYLIEDDTGVTLVDAGLPSMWSMLDKALDHLGRRTIQVLMHTDDPCSLCFRRPPGTPSGGSVMTLGVAVPPVTCCRPPGPTHLPRTTSSTGRMTVMSALLAWPSQLDHRSHSCKAAGADNPWAYEVRMFWTAVADPDSNHPLPEIPLDLHAVDHFQSRLIECYQMDAR